MHLPGSGSLALPEAHIAWFGHPSHVLVLPACSLCVPGHSNISIKAVNINN